jgi:hypothetical protein
VVASWLRCCDTRASCFIRTDTCSCCNPYATTTAVNLSRQNFKIVKSNAIGSSVGFSFLGLVTLKAPGYAEAITQLYQQTGVSEGKAQALVNVVHENSSTYFILFALPKITVRADIIEFTDGAVPVKTQDAQFIR